MDNILITEHFHSIEFRQPAGYGIEGIDYPYEWIESRLMPLCKILELIRSEIRNMPISILSGYRSYEYNLKHHIMHPGAVVASQHCEGLAADIRADFYTPLEIHRTILNMHNLGLIKVGGLGLYDTFIHLDIRDSRVLEQWKG